MTKDEKNETIDKIATYTGRDSLKARIGRLYTLDAHRVRNLFIHTSGPTDTAPEGFGGACGEIAQKGDDIHIGLGEEGSLCPLGEWLRCENPQGRFRLHAPEKLREAALRRFGLAMYDFTLLKTGSEKAPSISLLIEKAEAEALYDYLAPLFLAQDLINAPANLLGPDAFTYIVAQWTRQAGGTFRQIEGAALRQKYGLIHAVGKAAEQAPRLLDIRFDGTGEKKLTIIGKAVCFDTGGANIKPPAGMLLMKKDMGGGACALALALALRASRFSQPLQLLLPIVENSVDARSMRPSDVYESHAGLSVEIGNTDAEGRLILADAMAHAGDFAPHMLLTLATLTGAARIALGPDVTPFYTRDAKAALRLRAIGEEEEDWMWPMPLHARYRNWLRSDIADTNTVAPSPMAGSIVAALFLEQFLPPGTGWIHADLYGWTPKAYGFRPRNAAAQSVMALHRYCMEIHHGKD